jgi:hypothetical protein
MDFKGWDFRLLGIFLAFMSSNDEFPLKFEHFFEKIRIMGDEKSKVIVNALPDMFKLADRSGELEG